MISELSHRDGHKRAFAAQMLARLAICDPEEGILRDFPQLAAVLHDEKTVTARHTLQSTWRVSLVGLQQKAMVIVALTASFHKCSREKNDSLVRRDAITSPGNLLRETKYPAIAERAERLMSSEKDDRAQHPSWRKASA